MARGIGIDIGAHSCKASLLRGQGLEPEPLLIGESFPSVAYVEEDGSITVIDAANKAERNPSRGIWNVKRDVVLGTASLPDFSGISPIDVYREMIHAVLNRCNEQLLKNGDKTADSIVLTVPGILEKNPDIAGAMKRAAESIELPNGKKLKVELLVEPAGAGIFHSDRFYRSEKENRQHTIIVFDLGHSTLDVALITSGIENGKGYELHHFKPGTDVYCSLFDDRICEEINASFLKEDIDPKTFSRRTLYRIRQEAENLKHALTDSDSASVSIEYGDDYHEFTLTRSRFNELIAPYMDSATSYVEEAIEIAREKNLTVEAVVMAGGGSFIPFVEESLRRVAGKIPVVRSLKPIDAVSFGASRYHLMHNMVQRSQNSYGIQIPARGSSLERSVRFTIPKDVELPYEAKPLANDGFYCDERGAFDIVLYSSENERKENAFSPADECEQIRHFHFDLPANKSFSCALSINEEHCVKVTCRSDKGEAWSMTSHDAANAVARKE